MPFFHLQELLNVNCPACLKHSTLSNMSPLPCMHTKGHILDLIVTRQEEDLVASCGVGDFTSDHRAILVQLNCGKPHPIRQIVSFRKIKSLNSALLENDIMTSDLHNAELDNVDDAVAAYNTVLRGLLNKHVPLQTRSVAERLPTSQQISFKLSVSAAEVNEFGGSQVWQFTEIFIDRTACMSRNLSRNQRPSTSKQRSRNVRATKENCFRLCISG